MNYGLVVLVEPDREPLSLGDAKRQARVEHAAEDDLLRSWVKTARRWCERVADLRAVTQTVLITYRGFLDQGVAGLSGFGQGCGGCLGTGQSYGGLDAGIIKIPVRPLQSISAVRYYDTSGVLTTLPTTDWQVDITADPPLLAPAPGMSWPATQAGRLRAVEVECVVGHGPPDAVPEEFKQAMRLCVAYWSENRGDARDPAEMGIPPAATRLLDALSARRYR